MSFLNPLLRSFTTAALNSSSPPSLPSPLPSNSATHPPAPVSLDRWADDHPLDDAQRQAVRALAAICADQPLDIPQPNPDTQPYADLSKVADQEETFLECGVAELEPRTIAEARFVIHRLRLSLSSPPAPPPSPPPSASTTPSLAELEPLSKHLTTLEGIHAGLKGDLQRALAHYGSFHARVQASSIADALQPFMRALAKLLLPYRTLQEAHRILDRPGLTTSLDPATHDLPRALPSLLDAIDQSLKGLEPGSNGVLSQSNPDLAQTYALRLSQARQRALLSLKMIFTSLLSSHLALPSPLPSNVPPEMQSDQAIHLWLYTKFESLARLASFYLLPIQTRAFPNLSSADSDWAEADADAEVQEQARVLLGDCQTLYTAARQNLLAPRWSAQAKLIIEQSQPASAEPTIPAASPLGPTSFAALLTFISNAAVQEYHLYALFFPHTVDRDLRPFENFLKAAVYQSALAPIQPLLSNETNVERVHQVATLLEAYMVPILSNPTSTSTVDALPPLDLSQLLQPIYSICLTRLRHLVQRAIASDFSSLSQQSSQLKAQRLTFPDVLRQPPPTHHIPFSCDAHSYPAFNQSMQQMQHTWPLPVRFTIWSYQILHARCESDLYVRLSMDLTAACLRSIQTEKQQLTAPHNHLFAVRHLLLLKSAFERVDASGKAMHLISNNHDDQHPFSLASIADTLSLLLRSTGEVISRPASTLASLAGYSAQKTHATIQDQQKDIDTVLKSSCEELIDYYTSDMTKCLHVAGSRATSQISSDKRSRDDIHQQSIQFQGNVDSFADTVTLLWLYLVDRSIISVISSKILTAVTEYYAQFVAVMDQNDIEDEKIFTIASLRQRLEEICDKVGETSQKLTLPALIPESSPNQIPDVPR